MDHVTGLSLGRLVIGTGMLLAPESSLRLGLLDATAYAAEVAAAG